MANPTNYFEKHPVETYPIAMDYATAAPTGATLASGTWAAIDTGDQSDASSLVFASTNAVIDGDLAKVQIQNGVLNHDYSLGVTATFNTGDVLHDIIHMRVTNLG